MSEIPCNGCTKCCHNDLIMLHPELGDDPKKFDCYPVKHPFTGKPGWALSKKLGPTMDCIYLGKTGCTIHGRAPAICREFDCGKQFERFTAAERLRLVEAGIASPEVFAQGQRIALVRRLQASKP